MNLKADSPQQIPKVNWNTDQQKISRLKCREEKKNRKTCKSIRDMWDTHNRSNLCMSEIPETIKSKNAHQQ